MLVNAADMLKKAEAGKYGLGAFNTNNLEWTLAILQAAEEAKSPLILQCTAGAAKWMGGFKVCADMVKAAVEATGVTVPVALHLDHGSYEDCFKCIEAGFTSIMYDGSHEETFQLNLDRTKELVELAHSKGMSIEAEVGGIGGDLGDLIGVHVEDHLALEGGGGVVEVEDHMLGPVNGLEGAADEVLSGLYQHLNGHVVGDVSTLDQGADELVLRLGGGGEPHLDLLDADVHQGVKQLQLLPDVHGVNEGLVAVPQVEHQTGGAFSSLSGQARRAILRGTKGMYFSCAGFITIPPVYWGQGTKKRP